VNDSKAGTTRLTIVADRGDNLESVRRAVALADDMVEMGASVIVTGDLSIMVRFADEPKDEDPE
jgi:hypothetical protein